MVRTREEWHAHPQGRAVAGLPLLEISRLGAAPPEPPGRGARPLSGVRALDLTRVIAGPVCGRTLAEHGADVLAISVPHVPHMDSHVMDNGRGKLSARLDLTRHADLETLRRLVRDADVFVQSYRAGALAAHGLSPPELAQLRPGIVYATLNAWGHGGPWLERRGFDSLVQCASGIAHEGGVGAGLAGPRHLPAQALDHATGYLLAFGIAVALARRAREGGSWLVRASLACTGRWFDALGRAEGPEVADPGVEDVRDLLEETDTPFGRLSHVAPAARLSETPGRWERPTVPLGTHEAIWPALS
jgi:crotonobetainyl-CoA:carnitine CoA-transferase CaiB-like acyl-CoA transferase